MAGMDYQKAKDTRAKSFGDLMSDKLVSGQGIGQSLRATISQKTKASMKGLKEKIDPLNIAKFMTGGSSLGPALLGKVLGRSKEDIKFFAGKSKKGKDTASKLGPIGEGGDFSEILYSIENLLKSSFEQDKLRREEENQFAEEKEVERLRRHKELIEAITGKKYEGKASATKFKEEEKTSGSSIIDDVLGAFGGLAVLKSLGSFLVRVFAANPLVLGVASIGALFLLMSQMSKESHEVASNVSNAMDVSGGAKEIVEASEDEIANKKANILREAHRTGKIKGLDFSGEKAKKYLIEIGWDENTGTTQTERDAKALSEQKNETEVPVAPAAAPETTKTEVKPEPVTPATSPTLKESPATPAPAASPIPDEVPESGKQLNAVQKENLDLSIPVSSSDASTTVNNNTTSASSGGKRRTPLPLVRNVEETFQRMIFNSTRVV